jgi:hypothetical protein
MATTYDGSIAYHQDEIEKHKTAQNTAFHAMCDLAREAGLDLDVVIGLWVDGTFASNWKGWHEHGLTETKELAGWSRRDCMTCNARTEHNDENVCQECNTSVPEEVYA